MSEQDEQRIQTRNIPLEKRDVLVLIPHSTSEIIATIAAIPPEFDT